jgi:mitochondrial pyruvate carrier 2
LLTIGQWCLVIAGIADFARPASQLSTTQNVALTATGLIWTRWCLIIKPKNYLYVLFVPDLYMKCLYDIVYGLRSSHESANAQNRLAAVNFFLGIVGIVQVTRIAIYNQSKKEHPVEGAIDDVKHAAQS